MTAKVRIRRRRKSRFHRGVHSSPKAGDCKFRSGWEEKFMLYLDQEPSVVSYDYEKLSIEYVSNVRTGKRRKYWPDFLVRYDDGRVEVVEIKQQRRVHDKKILKKTLAAQDWCRLNNATFRILTEIELKSMGLL